MRPKFTILVLTAGVSLSLATVAAEPQRQTRERGVLVSVSTSRDVAVTDMKASEFIVRENGAAREVIRVAAAPPPSHVVLMIDDSQATQSLVPYLRPAMTNVISMMAALTPAPQQMLMTFGERPTRRVDFTPNPEQLLEVSKRIFPVSGSGAYFLQAITDACRDLRKREAVSGVILAFVSEGGPEFSSELHAQIEEALKSADASLWAVTLQQGQQSAASAMRERAAVLGDVTVRSGGVNKVVLTGQSIESGFAAVSNLITSRYLVTYGRPESMIPPDKLEVSSSRSGVRVRAPRWTGK
jgi:hypothetical protein